MTVEQIAVSGREFGGARGRVFLFAGHGDGLQERHAKPSAESIAFAAMELQQVGTHILDQRFDFRARVVHHQRDHRDFFRHQFTQHPRLPQQQPARAVRREHQADIVHAHLHRQAHVFGAGHSAEFDAGVGH